MTKLKELEEKLTRIEKKQEEIWNLLKERLGCRGCGDFICYCDGTGTEDGFYEDIDYRPIDVDDRFNCEIEGASCDACANCGKMGECNCYQKEEESKNQIY